jgi:hypothetical protein
MASSTDYPPVPPGVRTFNPRRLRRHQKAQATRSYVEDLELKVQELDLRRKSILDRAAGDGKEAEAKLTRLQGKFDSLLLVAVSGWVLALCLGWQLVRVLAR